MDPNSPPVFRHRSSPSSDRFLGLFSQIPTASSTDPDLQENDILWSSSASPSAAPDDPSPYPPSARCISAVGFPLPDHPGILAALPSSSDRRFLHRRPAPAASAVPPPSSKISIPLIPKPHSPREHSAHHSAPVNVLAGAPSSGRLRNPGLFDPNDDDKEDDEKMLPPHEIVARAARSPMTTFSVLEGKGRTLKGRDLRRVRNAVFRETD